MRSMDGLVPVRVWLNDHLSGKELFIRFTARAFSKLLSIFVFSFFPFGFEGRMWDLIVSVPDHCLSFYFGLLYESMASGKSVRKSHKYLGHMKLNNMGYKKSRCSRSGTLLTTLPSSSRAPYG